ncbi:MAG TPA: SDR family NAD(P)-dependent oxidoreductase [Steroidobacteraceae bacterium]|nr:SDR family NAD(P)-dependent oxidoreductase [Steroidobacteraceae bacterium]
MNIDAVRAVITGGASGLGLATARLLVAGGAQVRLLDVQEGPGNAAAATLGAGAGFIACDVTSEGRVDAAMQAAAAGMSGLNVLVNCAGIGSAARVLGRNGPMSGEFFSRLIQINLIGTYLCDKAAAVIMQHNAPGTDGERGVLIHTASVAAFEGQIGQAAYAAAKAGIAGMTLPIARELALFGIRCMTIAPGIFHTPMLGGMTPEVQDSLSRQVPFPARLGRPEEYAELVAAIIRIPMLNGTTIRLDGAIRMQPK